LDKFDRIYALDRLLRARKVPVPLDTIRQKLECGRATATRIIRHLRDDLKADVRYDAERGGYHYVRGPDGSIPELPGLWFTPDELLALLTFDRFVEELAPGLLREHFAPLRARITLLLGPRRGTEQRQQQLAQRVRVLAMGGRAPGEHFDRVAAATLRRQQLRLMYVSRSKDERVTRDVSPQRITHYRDCWYLDALDHLRSAQSGQPELRSFSIDRIEAATTLDARAVDVDEDVLDRWFAGSYGIFGGAPDRTAVLRFDAERARWVSAERWHPEQQGAFLDDGRYELRIPYSKSTELVMDILRHGAAVEVVAPGSLRDEVADELRHAVARYGVATTRRRVRPAR
jgi:predicted DNA-binding transcriptional regulator YafY